jgi:hypothetical protein
MERHGKEKNEKQLAHDKRALATGLASLLVGLKLVLELNVQISSVPLVGLAQ